MRRRLAVIGGAILLLVTGFRAGYSTGYMDGWLDGINKLMRESVRAWARRANSPR